MGGADQGPEPTGWELLRSIEGIRQDIKSIGQRVVSVDVYLADKQGNTERHERAEARIRDLELAAVDAAKLRRQHALTITLAILAPLVSGAVALIVKFI